VVGSIAKDGLLSFDSCCGRPMTRNSVLDGLRDSKLADIQVETWEKADWSWLTDAENFKGEKDMKS